MISNVHHILHVHQLYGSNQCFRHVIRAVNICAVKIICPLPSVISINNKLSISSDYLVFSLLHHVSE